MFHYIDVSLLKRRALAILHVQCRIPCCSEWPAVRKDVYQCKNRYADHDRHVNKYRINDALSGIETYTGEADCTFYYRR